MEGEAWEQVLNSKDAQNDGIIYEYEIPLFFDIFSSFIKLQY